MSIGRTLRRAPYFMPVLDNELKTTPSSAKITRGFLQEGYLRVAPVLTCWVFKLLGFGVGHVGLVVS